MWFHHTRSTVVGKAKVMSYEDIVEAQAKRNAKEAAVVKGKRGRKRKSSEPVVARVKGHGRVKWKSRRMKSKRWNLGITALFSNFDMDWLMRQESWRTRSRAGTVR
jgi:hypothetical protein